MSPELIQHVFGALQSLEKYEQRIAQILSDQKLQETALTCPLADQQKVIAHMRRIANQLQLELARNRQAEATRSLKIFYCLNSMVRPEVFSSFTNLTTGRSVQPRQRQEESGALAH